MAEDTPKIGRFLFDSITKGLYENPLCVLREYIQNSADAIDKAVLAKEVDIGAAEISITIDPTPTCPRIAIEDNGCGLPAAEAFSVLSSVGDSRKFGQRNRGFRGIGRLGGMAYCSEIVFRTKARGETKETINRWDCKLMVDMLNPSNQKHQGVDLREVIRQCAKFETIPARRKASDGYFQVEMMNVRCARNVLIDIVEVRKYLAQVAPVPFDYQAFPAGKEIDERLRREVLNYSTYRVVINYEELFKPYSTTVRLSQNKSDAITGIVPIEILDDAGHSIARGWRADRRDWLGAILRSDGVDGIRVRVGNILIGDNDLLDKAFRQERFNSYLIGEIHAVDAGLIPNSRRDDFEDSEIRETFYDKVRQALGEPLSRLVQKKSGEHSKQKVVDGAKDIYLTAKADHKDGFVSESHKEGVIKDLRTCRDSLDTLADARSADPRVREAAESQKEKIDALILDLEKNGESIIACSLSSAYSRSEKELVGRVLGHLYTCYGKAHDSVKLARLIVQKLNAEKKG